MLEIILGIFYLFFLLLVLVQFFFTVFYDIPGFDRHCSWFVPVPEPVQVPPTTRTLHPPAESSRSPNITFIRWKRRTKDWSPDVHLKNSSSGVVLHHSRPRPDSAPPGRFTLLLRPAWTSLGFISTPLIWQGRKRPIRGGPTPSRVTQPGPTFFFTKPSAPPTEYLSLTGRSFHSKRAKTSVYPQVAEVPVALPPSSATTIRKLRPLTEIGHQSLTHSPVTPEVEPIWEHPPQDGEEPGAGPRGDPVTGGRRQEKMLRPASSSDSSLDFRFPFFYPSVRPLEGPGTGPEKGTETGPRPGPRPGPVFQKFHPTFPLSFRTDVSSSCPPGRIWPFCTSGHLTSHPTSQTGRRQKVASFSSFTSSLAVTTSGAPSHRPLTSLLTRKEMLSVGKIPLLPFHPTSPPVFHNPFLPLLPLLTGSSLASPSSALPPLHPSPSSLPPPVLPPLRPSPSNFLPLPLFLLPSSSPFSVRPFFWSTSSRQLPSAPPTPAAPAADRNKGSLTLVTDQTQPREGFSAGLHPMPSDSTVSPALPLSYLQAPSISTIHSASEDKTVEEAWLQSEDLASSTTSLFFPLTKSFSFSPASKSGPRKGLVSTSFSLGGHTHPADQPPSPLPQPRPLNCLLFTWLCGRSSANRTSLLRPPPYSRESLRASGTASGWR